MLTISHIFVWSVVVVTYPGFHLLPVWFNAFAWIMELNILIRAVRTR